MVLRCFTEEPPKKLPKKTRRKYQTSSSNTRRCLEAFIADANDASRRHSEERHAIINNSISYTKQDFANLETPKRLVAENGS